MTSQIFALVFLAAVFHASWNLIAKRAASAGAAFVLAYRFSSTVLLAPWVIYVLVVNGMAWSGTVVGFILLSSVIHLAYGLSLQRGYQVADLSVVYPIGRGTGPVLASAGAYLWLGEDPSFSKIGGMLCVVAGVLLIATQGNWRIFSQARAWTGVRWGLLVGLLIACYTVADAYSVKWLYIAPVVLDWFCGLTITLIMAPTAWVRRQAVIQQMQGKWRLAVAVGLLSPLGYILVLYALQQGAQVSMIAPLREMSLMIGTVASFFILKEKVSAARLAGCLAIIAGVIALAQP
ncbi:DMT family transporter [Paralcaligenes sp. KSB-10]|uniref:DMT family transporter n=1 Tax=Paralcaligenes sp. KSB-10 TaxID=2901142 RepID=UPI001E53BC86|nr:DMT family transporter [Paralcaligenes sp. KSB-10]UHL64857.1 DMT family transporter [Paralcaligenes sp. KSB-10]